MVHESCKSQIAVLEMNGHEHRTTTMKRVERLAVCDLQSEHSGVQGVWMQGGT